MLDDEDSESEEEEEDDSVLSMTLTPFVRFAGALLQSRALYRNKSAYFIQMHGKLLAYKKELMKTLESKIIRKNL